MKCPNKNTDEWKELENALGEEMAYRAWFANNEETPSLEKAHKIIDIIGRIEDVGKGNILDAEAEDIINKISAEITPEHPINKAIDAHFENLSKYLGKLVNNKNYDELRRILTPEGSDKTSLVPAKKLLENAKKAESNLEGTKEKVKAVMATTLQSGRILDLMNEGIDDLLKTPESSKENFPVTQSYLQLARIFGDYFNNVDESFGRDFPILRDEIDRSIGKVRSLEAKVLEHDKSGAIQTLGPIIAPAEEEYHAKIQSQIDAQKKNLTNAERAGKATWALRIRRDIQRKEELLKYSDFRLAQNALDYLNGKKGDTNISFLVESIRASPDRLVGGFAQNIKQNFDDVDAAFLPERMEYFRAIAPHYRALGESYRTDRSKVGKAILYEEELLDDEGKAYRQKRYLNKFDGAEKELTRLNQDVLRLKQALETAEAPDKVAIQEELYKAQDALEDEKTNYWNREMTSEYYTKQAALWRDQIGRELREETRALWDKVQAIDNSSLVLGSTSTEDLELKADLLRQYTMMGNVNNPDGTPKTGIALQKAIRMRQIREFNQETHDWITDTKLFKDEEDKQSNYLIQFKGLAKDSPEYAEAMKKWTEENTVRRLTQKFWEDQKSIAEQIAALTSKIKDPQTTEDLGKINKEISGLIEGSRDEDGQPIGILIPEKGAERIKALEEQAQEVKQNNRKLSGLTGEQSARLSELIRKSKNYEIEDSERGELDDLLSTSRTNGLSKAEVKKLRTLYEDLDALRSYIPTEYYIAAHNNISGKYGVTLDDSGYVFEDNQLKPILESKTLRELLEHDDYRNWFGLNHYTTERYNVESKTVDQNYSRTRQWSKIIPGAEEYYEVVPTRKYQIRQTKKDYLTNRGNLVEGEHTDNRGRFLPKETPDGKYRNNKYYALQADKSDTGKALNGILEATTHDSFKHQQGAPPHLRLGYNFPSFPKTTRERIFDLGTPSKFSKHVWADFKALVTTEKEYSVGTGNFEDELAARLKKEEALNKALGATGEIETSMIPAVGTGIDDPAGTTDDVPLAHLRYVHSSMIASKINEMTPFVEGFQNILEQTDKPKKKAGVNYSERWKTRKAIDRLVENHLLGKSRAYELGKGVDVGVGMLKRLAGFAILKMNPLISLGNLAKWTEENLAEAGAGYYNTKNWANGIVKYAKWQKVLANDYLNRDVGHVSWQAQLDSIMKPVQEENFIEKSITRTAASPKIDIASGQFLSKHREFTSVMTQKALQLALMDATKLEQKLPDGSINLVTYDEAWELDNKGNLKLKDGIDKSWAPGGTNFHRFNARHDAINGRLNGYLSKMDQSFLQQYTTYSGWMFLKGWAIGAEINHWAFSNVKINKKRLLTGLGLGAIAGWEVAHHINPIMGPEVLAFTSMFLSGAFKSEGRYNTATGALWGRFAALTDMVAQYYDARSTKVEFSTDQKKRAQSGLRVLGFVTIASLIAYAIIGATAFAGFGKKFDETVHDEAEAKKKLKALSYWQKLALYEFLRLQTQTATFNSLEQHVEFLSEVPIIWNTIKDMYLLGEYEMSQVSDKRVIPGERGKQEVPRYKKPLESLTGINAIGATLGNEEALEKSIMRYENQRVR